MKKRILTILLAFVATAMTAGAATREAYAVVSTDNTTLTFYYDGLKSSREGTKYPISWTSEYPGWYANRTTITTVDFDESFADYNNMSSTSKMFYNMDGITTINHLERLNTKNVQNMSSMFDNCDNLQELDLSHFNTSNVKFMSSMFRYCAQLTFLDVSSFNVQKVTDMAAMFGGCTRLLSIYCDNDWMTMATALTSHTNMFKDCTNLRGAIAYDATKTDVNYANPDNGYFKRPTRYNIWVAGTQLSNIYLSGDPTTATVNVKGIGGITGTVRLRVKSTHNWEPVTYLLYLNNATIANLSSSGTRLEGIYSDEQLTINLNGTNIVSSKKGTGIDFHNNWQNDINGAGYTLTVTGTTGISVGDAQETAYTPSATSLKVDNGVAAVNAEGTDGYGICGSIRQEEYLNTLNLSNFSAKGTEGAICHFKKLSCGSGQGIVQPEGARVANHSVCDASGNIIMGQDEVVIGVGQPENYAWLDGTTLRICHNAQRTTHEETYDIPWSGQKPDWTGVSSTITRVSFASCNVSEPFNASYMFYGMENLEEVLYLEDFNTANVTSMQGMFFNCRNLTSLDLSALNTANVTDMSFMFDNCENLASLNLSDLNTAKVTNMTSMFTNCKAVENLDLSDFDTGNVTSMANMFKGCERIESLNLSSFNTSSVTDMSNMFADCIILHDISVGDGWSTAGVTYSDNMFINCQSLVGGQGTVWQSSNPKDKTYAHIDGGSSNPGYFSAVIHINADNFPDQNFRNWLLQQDYGLDGVLTKRELDAITVMEPTGRQIADLTGIGYFTALTTLNCQNNQLTALDVTNNTALTKIQCFHNRLGVHAMQVLVESLPTISSSSPHGVLVVYYDGDPDDQNSFTQEQVSAASAKRWDVKNMSATFQPRILINEASFPDENFRNWVLDNIDSNGNGNGMLEDNEFNGVTSINVSNKNIADLTGIEVFYKLEYLYCSNNQLTTLDISCFTMLGVLFCHQNQLHSITLPPATNSRLWSLSCLNNPIRGKNMDNLIASLPSNGTNKRLFVYDPSYSGVGAVCTPTQVKQATDKGWSVVDRELENYTGFTTPMGDANDDGGVTISDVTDVVNCLLGAQNLSYATGFVWEAADIDGDGSVTNNDVEAIVQKILKEPEYVDLGLPSGTLWATRNVGASRPEDYGDYFAWGETEGFNSGEKTIFDWSSYKWCEGSESTLTKYCKSSDHGYNGFTDNKWYLEADDDAAYVNWGPDWCTPTLTQFQELFNGEYTTHIKTTRNGVVGRLITSNVNGNSIFLPVTGMRDGDSLTGLDYGYGFYWTNGLSSDVKAYCIEFINDNTHYAWGERKDGMCVRPVRVSP
jgi:surface protein